MSTHVTPEQLDALYAQLAQAIHAAGNSSELYLAMLSLKLITQTDASQAAQCITNTLADLQQHEPQREGAQR